MLENAYRALYDSVQPEGALITRTRAAIRAQRRRRPALRLARLGTAAVCLAVIAVTAVVWPKLQPAVIDPVMPPEQITPGQNPGQSQVPDPGNAVLPPVSGDQEPSGPEDDRGDVKERGEIRELSFEELYQISGMSALMPRTIPKEYSFEAASLHTDPDGTQYLRGTFTNGYNYFEVMVRNFREEDRASLVQVENPDAYNITKYTIPLADSVPDELYDTMYYPVFLAEELTPQALELRKLRTSESGEEEREKISMNFAVQCGDLVVEYNLKGRDPQGIFESVTSADYFQD